MILWSSPTKFLVPTILSKSENFALFFSKDIFDNFGIHKGVLEKKFGETTFANENKKGDLRFPGGFI